MSSEILEILKGIDQTQTESEEGWWETSEGARFGAEKLDGVIALFDELLRVLQEAQIITAYAASKMTYADRMTKRAISTDLKVRAAIAKAKGEW